MMNSSGVTSETFEWVGPVVGPRVETRMSGLAYLTGIRDGVVPPPILGPLISAELVEIAQGKVQLICSAPDSQFGLLRELDPGLASLLLGAAVGCVAQTLVGLHEGWSMVESRCSYLRPTWPRVSSLMVGAEVVAWSSGRAHVSGELVDDCGQVLATISTTVEIVDL